jgi:hypothetical protein
VTKDDFKLNISPVVREVH